MATMWEAKIMETVSLETTLAIGTEDRESVVEELAIAIVGLVPLVTLLVTTMWKVCNLHLSF